MMSAKLIIPLLLALFMAPLIGALVLYFGPDEWRPQAVTRGVLIDPARALETVTLERADGTEFLLERAEGRWSLIYAVGQRCELACVEMLKQLVQLRKALGKEHPRLNLFLVLLAGSDMAKVELPTDMPGLTILRERARAGEGLHHQLGWIAGVERVHVVDPLGNYLMYHPVEAGPRPMLDDMRHLMKHSASG